jgi:hypothetical protein
VDDATRTAGRETLRDRLGPLAPTRPGETRFWCSCDTARQRPFLSSAALLEHIEEARAMHQPAES